jgi:hypothetical protein
VTRSINRPPSYCSRGTTINGAVPHSRVRCAPFAGVHWLKDPSVSLLLTLVQKTLRRDDRKDRDVRADAECQDADRNGGKSRRAAEETEAVPDILKQHAGPRSYYEDQRLWLTAP